MSWKEHVNRVLLGVEGSLAGIASERKLGTDFIDSFFPEPEKKAKKATGGGAGTAPGSPTP